MRTNYSNADQVGLGPKKTFLVIGIVVVCIGVLFPKIFYPMLMNQQHNPPKDYRNVGPKQERPAHLRPETIHAAMKERGRTIPPHPHLTVPIVERSPIEKRPGSPPGVHGIPGPGMRMQALGGTHQTQKTGGGLNSIIMPIYTLGIVAFFVYTIVKILMKTSKTKQEPAVKESDPVFCQKVFEETKMESKKGKLGASDYNAIYSSIQGILHAANEQLKEIEIKNGIKNAQNNNVKEADLLSSAEEKEDGSKKEDIVCNGCNGVSEHKDSHDESSANEKPAKDEHDHQTEVRLKNLMESCNIKAVTNDENSETKSIFLDGELPHDSKILVSASETTTEIQHHEDEEDTDDDIILSGKMTISLISLNPNHEESEDKAAVVNSVTLTETEPEVASA